MAEHDPKTPDRGPVPDPHVGKPKPRPDAHTRRPQDAEVVRPDQYEDLGPVPELFGAAGAEAATFVSDDERVRRAAIERGAEAEGLETAQIFGLLLAIVVVLFLIVAGVWALTARSAEAENQRRQAGLTYRELQENRTHAQSLLEGYDRAVDDDALFRIPLARAEELILNEYRQQVAAAPYASPEDRAGFNLAFPRARAANFRPTPALPGVRPPLETTGGVDAAPAPATAPAPGAVPEQATPPPADPTPAPDSPAAPAETGDQPAPDFPVEPPSVP